MKTLDVIIIPGYESSTNKLSKIMKQRVEKGIEIYKEKKVKIIMSGGFSLKHKKDPGFRESELMKQYAIEKGIPAKDILIENQSRDTHGNAYFTKQIIKSHSWKNIAVITSDFHVIKTKFFFHYVYGNNYNISYFEVETNLSENELYEINKKEKKSIDTMKKIYEEKKIKIGDDKKIGSLLKKFYSKF